MLNHFFKKSDHEFLTGLLCLILAQIMVALNIVLSKILLAFIPVIPLLTMRFGLAFATLLPLHWVTSDKTISIQTHLSALEGKDWFFLLAQALCAGVLFNVLMLMGLHYTDANIAGIITSALPAIIAVISWFALGERLSRKKTLCIFFATLGLVIIAFDKLQGVSELHSIRGDLLVFCSLLPEAGFYVLCKIYPNRLPIFLVSALMNAVNAFILLLFLPWLPTFSVSMSVTNGMILLILGLSAGLFFAFWTAGAKRVDSTMASLSTATMPVSTVILAWLLLGEYLSLKEALGMVLVICSIIFYAKR